MLAFLREQYQDPVPRVWFNNGTGLEVTTSGIMTPAENACELGDLHSSAYVDIDGDCRPDLVLHCKKARPGEMKLQTWLNNGEAGYKIHQEYDLPAGAQALTFADISGLACDGGQSRADAQQQTATARSTSSSPHAPRRSPLGEQEATARFTLRTTFRRGSARQKRHSLTVRANSPAAAGATCAGGIPWRRSAYGRLTRCVCVPRCSLTHPVAHIVYRYRAVPRRHGRRAHGRPAGEPQRPDPYPRRRL